jgi:hypothetical protein
VKFLCTAQDFHEWEQEGEEPLTFSLVNGPRTDELQLRDCPDHDGHPTQVSEGEEA